MAKISLSTISSGYGSVAALNNNFSLITTALENTLSRDGTTPNAMSADFDLNGFGLLNVSDISLSGGVSLQSYVDEAYHWAQHPVGTLVPEGNMSSEYSAYHWAITAEGYSDASALSALDSASSASAAASSEAACAAYSSLGLGAAVAYDFGLITDAVIVFPTDFGTIV